MPRFSGVAAGTVLDSQNALVASTLSKVSRDIADNFFSETPFYFWLKYKNRVIPWTGGESMERRLMYGKNTDAKAYDPYETLSASPPKGFGNAVYMRSYYRVPILYSRATLSANMGDAAVGNLVSDLKKQAELSLIDTLNTDLWNETSSPSTKNITPLPYMIEPVAAASQDSIVGGITKYTNAWWVNQFQACGANEQAQSVRQLFMDCKNGADKPDLGLADDTSYIKLEDALFTQRRFENSTVADFGFDNITYRGITIISDSGMDFDHESESSGDGAIFFINSKYLKLAIVPDADFKLIPPEYDKDQDAYKGVILLDLQLVCSNLKRQGVTLGTAYTT